MIEKLCVLSLALAVGVPLFSIAGIRWALARRALFVLAVAAISCLTLPAIETSLLWDATYRGSTRGLTVGISDFAVLALIVVVWCVRRRVTRWPTGSWLILALMAWFVGTGLFAERRDYMAFEVVTLARAYALYWMLVNYFEEFGDLRLFVGALVGVVFIQAAVGAQQHLSGQYRATGLLGDPNLLGMYLNMLLAVLLAVAMESRGKWQWACLGAVGAGGLLVLITYSRGAWLVAAGTSTLVVLGLSLLHAQARKLALLVPCAAACLLLLVVKADGIAARWQGGLATITDARDSARTLGPALAMVRDYPVTGVGLNNISYALNTRHYGDAMTPDERQVTHNLYLTTAAETGFVGVVLLVSLVVALVIRGFWLAWRARRAPLLMALALGASAAVLSVGVHSSAEWVARVVVIVDMVAIGAAVITALQGTKPRSALREQAEAW